MLMAKHISVEQMSPNPEAELAAAKAQLARCLQRQHNGKDAPSSPTGSQRRSLTVNRRGRDLDDVASLLWRAREVAGQLEVLDLSRAMVRLAAEASGSGGAGASLVAATDRCTALGLLLLRAGGRRPPGGADNGHKAARFHAALRRWYGGLHDAARRAALAAFRSGLRRLAPEYPADERSAVTLRRALAPPLRGAPPGGEEWRAAARCLVELQVVREALRRGEDDGAPPAEERRLDLVDELCRPLAERLRYHFLEERTAVAGAAPSASASTSSRVDRLPEWLFRYLREAVEDHGVRALVERGAQPLVDAATAAVVARAALPAGRTDAADAAAAGDPAAPLECLQHEYRRACAPYFLREVARMARHALRAKSFFRHPDVVGSECRDPAIVLRGIEQLFLFDGLMMELSTEESGGEADGRGLCDVRPEDVMTPPRMVDTFLASDEYLMEWWLEQERDGVLSILDQCAVRNLSSLQSEDKDGGPSHGAESSSPSSTVDGAASQPPSCPPVAELFVSLLQSARCKANTFCDPRPRGMYVAAVVAPLCAAYIDLVRAEAAHLRRRLLARPPGAAGLPPDGALVAVVVDWAALVTGTHLATQAVRWRERGGPAEARRGGTPPPPREDPSSPDDGAARVAAAMERLRDALVEDFAGAFVETLVMERAKFAAYAMRAPFLLGQRNRDESGGDMLSLSPDLNDSVHVVSLAAHACATTMRKLRHMRPTHESDDGRDSQSAAPEPMDPHFMLYFGSQAIREALRFALGQKLLDVAVDPQGMTPEIHVGGARQFQRDVAVFERALGRDGGGREESTAAPAGPMERAAAAARLMSLEPSQLAALREALGALLAVPTSGIASLFGGRSMEDMQEQQGGDDQPLEHFRLDADDFYRDNRLFEEANSMMEAKGFVALSLGESLSIINRRC